MATRREKADERLPRLATFSAGNVIKEGTHRIQRPRKDHKRTGNTSGPSKQKEQRKKNNRQTDERIRGRKINRREMNN